MKSINLILSISLAIASTGAKALTCETDQECLSEGIKLIKQARKLGACDPEVQAAAKDVENVASQSNTLRDLEICVFRAKKAAKVQKKLDKRLERIQKAVAQEAVKK